MQRTLEWQIVTVSAIRPETPQVKTFRITLKHWIAHSAGQPYDLRLTAPAASNGPPRCMTRYRSPRDRCDAADLTALTPAVMDLDVVYTNTRAQPPGWSGYARRIDAAMLREVAAPLAHAAQPFICVPTLLV